MNREFVSLAQAISSLRTELSLAIEQARTEGLRFSVKSIELQMQVVATAATAGTASGGLWQVVTIGGSIDHSNALTHQVTLTLDPKLDGKSEIHVGDDDVSWRPSVSSP